VLIGDFVGARFYGEVANTPAAPKILMRRLSPGGDVVTYFYEAAPRWRFVRRFRPAYLRL